MAFEYKQAKRLLEAAKKDRAVDRFYTDLREAFAKQELRGEDFSLRKLFTEFVPDGHELVESFDPRSGGDSVQLREANVETSAFSNITGQIVYNELMQAFENPALIGSQLMDTVPTSFDGEKIAGVSLLADDIDSVGESKPYPRAGVREDWVETPQTTKRGFIVPVTKEAIFFDRTAQVLDHCRGGMQTMALNKEKRIIDAVTGVTTLYNRKGRGLTATYGDNSGNHDWDNLAASNALQDYTDIQNVLSLFDAMSDPNTGEPIILPPELQVLVPWELWFTLNSIINATETRQVTNTSTTTISGNPLRNANQQIQPMWSPYVSRRTSSTSTWFAGAFKKAFKYMENWGPTMVEAPIGSYEEFNYDVVAQFKTSERGTPACVEPRYVVKCTQ